MPCSHKFQNYLDLENLNFFPTTLIVGTFNPGWPANNYANWFYGRTGNNNFWEVLPRIYNELSLINHDDNQWKQFCSDKRIAITDLIRRIDDAEIAMPNHNKWLANYSDSNIANHFDGHIFVDVVELLINNPTINNVYLTRGVTEPFWANLWQPVRNYCDQNQIGCEELLTPSGNARFQLGRYNALNPDNQLTLPNFIFMRWLQQ